MPATEKDLLALLGDMKIEFSLFRHPPIFTVEENQKFIHEMPGGHCKCLFVKDKKAQMVLAIVHEGLKANLKALASDLGLGRFSFCNEERMVRILGVTPGAVTPFALMNVSGDSLEDKESLAIVVDSHLQEYDVVHFHPLHNEATVAISPGDLLKFIRHAGFEPLIKIMV